MASPSTQTHRSWWSRATDPVGRLGAAIRAALDSALGIVFLLYLGCKSTVLSKPSSVVDITSAARGITRTAVKTLVVSAAVGFALGYVAVLVAVRFPKDIVGLVFVSVVIREAVPLMAAFLLIARAAPMVVIQIATDRMEAHAKQPARTVGLREIQDQVPPRLVRSVVSAFMLTAAGLAAAFLGGVMASSVDVTLFTDKLIRAAKLLDLPCTVLKPAVFGIIVCVVSCHQGFATTKEDAIPAAPGAAIIECSVLCLVANAIVTAIFYFVS